MSCCMLRQFGIVAYNKCTCQESFMKEQNKKLIFVACEEIENNGRFDLIPELFADHFVSHSLVGDLRTGDLEDYERDTRHFREAFPDWSVTINLEVAEGDLTAVRYTASGTNTGPFRKMPPTGRKIKYNVFSVYRISDEKIAERWILPDDFGFESQLGFIPGEACGISEGHIADEVQFNDAKVDTDVVEKNRALALLANREVWNLGNLDSLEQIFSDDFVQHLLPFGATSRGLETFREMSIKQRTAFPDWKESVNFVIAEGDYVFLQFTSTGTNTGDFMGNPPTGRSIKINEATFFRIVDGNIIEQWLIPDILSLNRQMGILPKNH